MKRLHIIFRDTVCTATEYSSHISYTLYMLLFIYRVTIYRTPDDDNETLSSHIHIQSDDELRNLLPLESLFSRLMVSQLY